MRKAGMVLAILCCAGCGDSSSSSMSCASCGSGRTCDVYSGRCVADVVPAHCSNGEKDAAESGVDCGGLCPEACANNVACLEDADCRSLYCADGVCHNRRCSSDSECDKGKCDGGFCATCLDGKANGDETALDCGGAFCGGCGVGLGCRDASDCASGLVCQSGVCAAGSGDVECVRDADCEGTCRDGRCVEDSGCQGDEDCAPGLECRDGACMEASGEGCSDGRQNGDETDVDCGGSCRGCAEGKSCQDNGDCGSFYCEGGTCAVNPCEPATAGALLLNELMSRPDVSKELYHVNGMQQKYLEIYNTTDRAIDLASLSLVIDDKPVALSGCIEARTYLVIHPSDVEMSAPTLGGEIMASEQLALAIPDSGAFTAELSRDTVRIHGVYVPDMSGKPGVSAALPPVLADRTQDEAGRDVLIPHDEIKTDDSGVHDFSPSVPNYTTQPQG